MSSPNLHPMLNVAVKAARSAGAIINRAALDVEAVRISQKQVNDFVTEVDHASEKVIIETLLTAYPGHGILAEESGSEHGAQDSEFVWIIDPLDGTTNFIHGFPVYCVSIALAVQRQDRAGRHLRPQPQRPVHRHQGPRRLPERPPHARVQTHPPAGVPDLHRLSRSARATTSTPTCT